MSSFPPYQSSLPALFGTLEELDQSPFHTERPRPLYPVRWRSPSPPTVIQQVVAALAKKG